MIYVSKNLESAFKTRKQNKSGHFTRMPQIVKADEIPDPVPVGLLGVSIITTGADDLTDLLTQAGLIVHADFPSVDNA